MRVRIHCLDEMTWQLAVGIDTGTREGKRNERNERKKWGFRGGGGVVTVSRDKRKEKKKEKRREECMGGGLGGSRAKSQVDKERATNSPRVPRAEWGWGTRSPDTDASPPR